MTPPATAHRWIVFVAIGVVSILLGLLAWVDAITVSIASTIIIGAALLLAGIAQIVHAFSVRGWSGFALSLLGGALYAATGILVMREPVAGSIIITVFVALCLALIGAARIVIALTHRHLAGWWIVLFGGLISVLVGGMLYASLPWSGLWMIGIFVAVELIAAGFSWVQIGLGMRLHHTAP